MSGCVQLHNTAQSIYQTFILWSYLSDIRHLFFFATSFPISTKFLLVSNGNFTAVISLSFKKSVDMKGGKRNP